MLQNRSYVFKMYLKEVIAELLYMMIFIITNLKFKQNSGEISHKIKTFLVEKIQIRLIKVYELHS